MNPYLVKELRQLTRSKIVSGGLVLLLFGQLLAAVAAIPIVDRMSTTMAATGADAPPLGTILLAVFDGILVLALCIVLPFLVFARFVAENPKDRTPVELATAMPPSAVIDGKVQAGLVLAAALAAGSLPFQLLCIALRGVDLVAVLLSCAGTLLVCSVQLHLAARFAAPRTASAGRRWATMAVFQFIFGQYVLFGGVAMAITATSVGGTSFRLGSAGSAWGLLVALLLVASVNLLLRAHATRSLSAPTTDRDRVPRLTLLVLWAAWGAAAAVSSLVNGDLGPVPFWAGVFALIALLHLNGAAGSPRGIPRRLLAERSPSRLRRLLRLPFVAGFPGALLFVSAILAASTVAVAAAAAADPAPPADFGVDLLRFVVAALYVVAIPTFLRGLPFRRAPRLVPVFSIVALLGLQLVPPILGAGFGGPPLGFPFFLPGVFDCPEDILTIHLVFSLLAVVIAFATVFEEFFSSLRAYLAPLASVPPPLPDPPLQAPLPDSPLQAPLPDPPSPAPLPEPPSQAPIPSP